MVRQISVSDKRKIQHHQMEEGNPTLTGILRRRQYSSTEYKDEVLQELKSHHPPPPPPGPQTITSAWKQKFSKVFPHQKNPKIDTSRLNLPEWPRPKEQAVSYPSSYKKE